ncbi:MAG: septum formation initiator family protein [Betaproteobacteria bacterium]|jgi:cell division protein FtsB|nr:septum formation initiator family protein [Betaproteobacteria bacterium]MBK7656470.1 septum formation initiator family protein [Betaproteobacteria bacterium]
MAARLVPLLLIGLLVAFHAQLWVGRGSIPDVNQLSAKLVDQITKNKESARVNERIASEVRDLKEGLAMVEERARYELGMVKPNEIFVQVMR